MILLGTISNICGQVLRGLLKSAAACVGFVFLGVFSIAAPVLERGSELITSDAGLAARGEVCDLPGVGVTGLF